MAGPSANSAGRFLLVGAARLQFARAFRLPSRAFSDTTKTCLRAAADSVSLRAVGGLHAEPENLDQKTSGETKFKKNGPASQCLCDDWLFSTTKSQPHHANWMFYPRPPARSALGRNDHIMAML